MPHTFRCWWDGGERVHEITAREGGATLTAAYAAGAGEVDLVATVAAPERSADSHPAFGEALANAFDAFGICAGRDEGGAYQAAFAFALEVPRGAAIVAAVLRVVATADQSGTPRPTLRAYDVPSAAPFSSVHTHALTVHQPLADAAVEWSFPPFTPGQLYESPDLTALVAEVVGRPDWQPGGYLGLVLDGTPSAAGSWRCLRNFASGSPASLAVRYAPPPAEPGPGDDCGPGEGPRAWRRCDFNCDGVHDLSDAIAGLGFLFGGRPGSCCEALADCNADGEHDISDWIFAILYLFRGGAEPAPPFRACGVAGGEECPAYPHCGGA